MMENFERGIQILSKFKILYIKTTYVDIKSKKKNFLNDRKFIASFFFKQNEGISNNTNEIFI